MWRRWRLWERPSRLFDKIIDGVFSALVFRNLESVPETLSEICRVFRPDGRAVILDLGRPRNRFLAAVHRMGTAVVVPLAGLLAGSLREYWYLHRSLDKLGAPEEIFVGDASEVLETWRMGVFGCVHEVVVFRGGMP